MSCRKIIGVLAAAAALAPALPAAAQNGNGHAREIRPGTAALDGTRVRPGSWRLKYVRVAEGAEQELGVMTHELSIVDYRGQPALRSVQAFSSARGEGADTVFAAPRSLAPLAHRSNHGGSALLLDFQHTRVTGRATKDGATKEIDQMLDRPAFDANLFEVVIGALPLEPGYSARLPMYAFDGGGVVLWNVLVKGETDADVAGKKVPAWEVEVTFDKGAKGTFLISRDGRLGLGATMISPDGAQFRMIPVPMHDAR